MKSVFGKVSRSGLYYLLIWQLPVRRASVRDDTADALGGLTVVGLSLGIMILMRCLLTN